MKKCLKTSFIYLIIGLVAGVFYREFTKFNEFTSYSTLNVMHTHLLVLGSLLFLILALFFKDKDITSSKKFKTFYIVYNIGLAFFVTMLLTRGIFTVCDINVKDSIHSMISGIAGLSHITLTVGLFLIYPLLKETLKND